MSVLTKEFRGEELPKHQNFFCRPDEIDHFLKINQFPEFVFVKEFLESHNIEKNLIELLEENYHFLKKSSEIQKKLSGMNMITLLSISINLKTVKILVDSLLKIVKIEEEEKTEWETIKEKQFQVRGF